ncbi:unnamed protein product, partial [Musa hybrid cultivar]
IPAVGHTSQVRLGSLTCKLSVGPRRNRMANGTGVVQHLIQNSIWFPIDTHRSSRRRRRRRRRQVKEVIFVPHGQPMECKPKEPVRVNVLFKHVRKMLSGSTAVIAEACDSWFNCRKVKLPEGCGYEFQMQCGSIGWSVGATLGSAQAGHEGQQACDCLHRRRKLSGDSTGRVDDAALRAEQHRLPHKQWRAHHRGGDPRRALQCHQELGLHRPGGRHPRR